MRKVDYVELCTYLANVYKEATGKYYSNELSDWWDDIRQYENNVDYVETSEDGKTERYDVDELTRVAETGKCMRISFSIKYITIGNTVNTMLYLSESDYERYVKDYV